MAETNLNHLPDVLLVKIFSFLEIDDLCLGVRKTCNRWRSLCFERELWRSFDFTGSCIRSTSGEKNLDGFLELMSQISEYLEELTIDSDFAHRILPENKIHFPRVWKLNLRLVGGLYMDVDELDLFTPDDARAVNKNIIKNCPNLIHIELSVGDFLSLEEHDFLNEAFKKLALHEIHTLKTVHTSSSLSIYGPELLKSLESMGAGLEDIAVWAQPDAFSQMDRYPQPRDHEKPDCLSPFSSQQTQRFKKLAFKAGAWQYMAMDILRMLPVNSQLQHLDISNCDVCSDDQITKVAQHCPLLTVLIISGCQHITDVGLSSVAHHCPNIRKLVVNGSEARYHPGNITDVGLRDICHGCRDLRYLDVCFCPNISNTGIAEVAVNCPKLEHLGICGCVVLTDHAIKEVAKHSKFLRTLNASECTQLTSEGINMLVSNCKWLTRLQLGTVHYLTGLNFDGILDEKATSGVGSKKFDGAIGSVENDVSGFGERSDEVKLNFETVCTESHSRVMSDIHDHSGHYGFGENNSNHCGQDGSGENNTNPCGHDGSGENNADAFEQRAVGLNVKFEAIVDENQATAIPSEMYARDPDASGDNNASVCEEGSVGLDVNNPVDIRIVSGVGSHQGPDRSDSSHENIGKKNAGIANAAVGVDHDDVDDGDDDAADGGGDVDDVVDVVDDDVNGGHGDATAAGRGGGDGSQKIIGNPDALQSAYAILNHIENIILVAGNISIDCTDDTAGGDASKNICMDGGPDVGKTSNENAAAYGEECFGTEVDKQACSADENKTIECGSKELDYGRGTSYGIGDINATAGEIVLEKSVGDREKHSDGTQTILGRFRSGDGPLDTKPFQPYSKLQVLDLSMCSRVADKSVNQISKHCPDLLSLSLAGCFRITDKSVTNVVKSCRKLRCLDLHGLSQIQDSKLTDRTLVAIGEYAQNLERLVMRRNFLITSSGIKLLLSKCVNLCELEITVSTGTFLKGKDLQQLPSLENLKDWVKNRQGLVRCVYGEAIMVFASLNRMKLRSRFLSKSPFCYGIPEWEDTDLPGSI